MNKDEIKKRIKELESKRMDLGKQKDAVFMEIHALGLQLVELEYGVKVGSVVLSMGQRFRVADIDERPKRPWLYGSPTRKDGSWSTRVLCLYTNWELEPTP